MEFARGCLPFEKYICGARDSRPIRASRPIEHERIRDILARTTHSSRDEGWPGTVTSSASKGDSVGGVRGCIIEPCVDRAHDTKVWPTLGVRVLHKARRCFASTQGSA